MARKPGVMIYFDIRGILEMLTLEERGSLFSTIMEYGETGRFCERDLCDKARLIWIGMTTAIGTSAKETVTQAMYGGSGSEAKRLCPGMIGSFMWMSGTRMQMHKEKCICLKFMPTTTTAINLQTQ